MKISISLSVLISALFLIQSTTWALELPRHAYYPGSIADYSPAQLTDLLTSRDLRNPQGRLQVERKYLDLSDLGLTSLEGISDIEIDGVNIMGDIEELNLGNNQLTTLPPEIGRLTHLRSLGLSGNRLITLPAEIRGLRRLQTLHLGFNQLSTLPPEIGRLTHLQELWLNSNELEMLPPEIGRLTNLQFLVLEINQLDTLPPEIGRLTSLQALNLGNNRLSSLPPQTRNLTHLQRLNLGFNQFSSLPAEIRGLTNLQWLNLTHNQLINLPAWIGGLANLNRLDLPDNRLSQEQVTQIHAIFQGRHITLDLSDQQPASMALEPRPISAAEFAQIASEAMEGAIGLSEEEKARLASKAKECAFCLDEITAEAGYKTACPPKGHLFHRECLQTWVESQQAKVCPTCKRHVETGQIITKSITDLISEDNARANVFDGKLKLDNQNVGSLDGLADIPNIASATEIHVIGNLLTQIPANAFTAAPSTKLLDVSQNEITTIDENAFNGLPTLEILDLRKNKISDIPAGAITKDKLPALKVLDLRGNPISEEKIKELEGLLRIKIWHIKRTMPASSSSSSSQLSAQSKGKHKKQKSVA